ncbi:MAG: transglycosylase domain-containing protein, partial [Clostridia bacterium]|nr:transglycosylase domain-containing protein [Clostridia bacterium]
MKYTPHKFKLAKKKIHWGDFSLKTFKIIGKTVMKVLGVALNVVLTVLLIGLLTGIIAGTAFAVYIKNYVDPTIDESLFMSGSTSQTTKLYYYDYTDRINRIGEAVELEDQRLYGTENSLWAPLSQIPKDLRNAFISIEDKRFMDHKGVDWIRSVKAVANFFLGFDDTTGGGSTITQQLIKNVTEYDDVTIQRKVQEMMMALNLEKVKTKDEILELYLNIVPLSQRCIGVQAAANTYFSKDVSELSLIEC